MLYRLTVVPDDGDETYLELPNDKAALALGSLAAQHELFGAMDEQIGKEVQVARPDGSVVGVTKVKE
jgi:hypothetical protein